MRGRDTQLAGRLHLLLTWRCNLACTYCFQNGHRAGRAEFHDLDAWIAGFERLPGRWDIHITGGEPLVSRHLCGLVRGLREIGHDIQITTNLRADERRIADVVAAAEGDLGVSASWHPEYWSADRFFARLDWVRSLQSSGERTTASLVLSPSTIDVLEEASRASERYGLVLLLRPERRSGHSIDIPHGAIERLAGSHWRVQATRSYISQTCSAGMDYFAVDADGTVYRCFADQDDARAPLGNFLDGDFSLQAPRVCGHEAECCLNSRLLPTRMDRAKAAWTPSR